MSIFEDENICNKLNDKYVFVGLNSSSTHGNQDDAYKLRYALETVNFGEVTLQTLLKYLNEIVKNPRKLTLKNSCPN